MPRTPRHIEYFNMHGTLDRGFLHPGGKQATEKLLSHLASLPSNAVVLEIGCGTGETARHFLERFPHRYIGVDASPSMLERTTQKLLPYIDRCTLIACDLKQGALPLEPTSVDAIIAESVFAVLDAEKTLRECHRVLKRGGFLCWNDRIWSGTIFPDKRREANALTEKLLGVPAAPEQPATMLEWVQFVERLGFVFVSKEQCDPGRFVQGERHTLANRLHTMWQVLIHPSYVGYWLNNRTVERKFKHVWDTMESWMFVARKE